MKFNMIITVANADTITGQYPDHKNRCTCSSTIPVELDYRGNLTPDSKERVEVEFMWLTMRVQQLSMQSPEAGSIFEK